MKDGEFLSSELFKISAKNDNSDKNLSHYLQKFAKKKKNEQTINERKEFAFWSLVQIKMSTLLDTVFLTLNVDQPIYNSAY